MVLFIGVVDASLLVCVSVSHFACVHKNVISYVYIRK